MIGSTGSPWDPETWLWLFHTVLEGRKPIVNYSGGTEISGGILCGNFLTPLKPCAFSGPVVGMDADVVDADGNPVRGAVGELVIRQPWIGMTRGFWQDRERYFETYWNRIPGVWVHGDFAAIDEDGLVVHPRAQRRHHQGGGQAARSRRSRGYSQRPSGGQGIGRHRRAAPHQGPGGRGLLRAQRRLRAGRAIAQGIDELVAAELGKPLKPRDDPFRRRRCPRRATPR